MGGLGARLRHDFIGNRNRHGRVRRYRFRSSRACSISMGMAEVLAGFISLFSFALDGRQTDVTKINRLQSCRLAIPRLFNRTATGFCRDNPRLSGLGGARP